MYGNDHPGKVFEVPSDWKVIIAYNMGYSRGEIKVRSSVYRYPAQGSEYHKQPTRTYITDPPGQDNEAEAAYQRIRAIEQAGKEAEITDVYQTEDLQEHLENQNVIYTKPDGFVMNQKSIILIIVVAAIVLCVCGLAIAFFSYRYRRLKDVIDKADRDLELELDIPK